MDIGLSIPIRLTADLKEQYVYKAQSVGVFNIWVGDNPPVNNAFLDIGRLISKTETMNFWTGVTSPFYYSLEVLFSLSVWFSRNYPGRFGLGLGIGNSDVIENDTIKAKPFTNFQMEIDKLQEIIAIRRDQTGEDDFPPLAFGGLGNKMISLATKKADYLLLNSVSEYDIERALERVRRATKSSSKKIEIIPYGMIQIVSEKQEMSLTMWNITKDIAKSCSTNILKSHGYSAKKIEQIRSLEWNRDKKVPKGDIIEIVNDFGIYGTIEEILQRLDEVKSYENNGLIHQLVLGWMHDESQWDDLREIVKFLR
ncbi:MAG: LLM class flavin-dependent oxidoreductase [Candidatus Heimdallarchaeota archaeon]|nr:LLM class flavin-dependent oxidoreductase [Candidatus Heimdallarchaeota archaeon]